MNIWFFFSSLAVCSSLLTVPGVFAVIPWSQISWHCWGQRSLLLGYAAVLSQADILFNICPTSASSVSRCNQQSIKLFTHLSQLLYYGSMVMIHTNKITQVKHELTAKSRTRQSLKVGCTIISTHFLEKEPRLICMKRLAVFLTPPWGPDCTKGKGIYSNLASSHISSF